MFSDDVLIHYGTLHKSGRYPWGSGGELISTIEKLVDEGFSEKEIAASLGMSTTELRDQKAIAKLQRNEELRIFVTRQKESGMSITKIAEEANLPQSTVRDLLKKGIDQKYLLIKKIADILKDAVEKHSFIDVGDGVEQFLGVTATKMKNALRLLTNEGYTLHYLNVEQLGTGKKTSLKVLAAPGVKYTDVSANKNSITVPLSTSSDNGYTFDEPLPIVNYPANKVHIIKDPDKDGLIEIRRNVPELSMGDKKYAQVRIAVEGTHYIKGVAVYNEANMPPGKDIVFYTSKKLTDNPLDNLKEQKMDEANPFGAVVKQKFYTDPVTGERKASALNIVNEEGDWLNWADRLSSQFLSKQDPDLAAQQLKIVSDKRKDELDEILNLTNDVVKKHLLLQLADAVDSDAVQLKAAAFSGQTNSVLIPIKTIEPNEVYAPNYNNGDVVVLVRHPHGGIFEIPKLVVNNKNPEAISILGKSPKDAIGIHPSVAQKLSGADFDGDAVFIAPANNRIRTAPTLKALRDFQPKDSYPYYDGMKIMSEAGKQREMGIISNLITDMTIRGASQDEIARAVRHSMVVIDAAKHKLNYKQSYLDNGIAALKQKYQSVDGKSSGASTIISRAKSTVFVPQRHDHYDIDPETGKKIHLETRRTIVDKDGNQVPKLSKSSRMYEVDDARTLSSGTRIERVYANHANLLKSIGNLARKHSLESNKFEYSPEAKKVYQREVDSLLAKFDLATKNHPKERQAQILGNQIYKAKLAANPEMSGADRKTAKGRALIMARLRVGAKKDIIDITPSEWQAIQAGAITPTRLSDILRNADPDQVKAYATPRSSNEIPPSKLARMETLLKAGYTTAEIARALGVSVNQINQANRGE